MSTVRTPGVENPDPLLTVEQAAEYLNTTPRWLRRMRERKLLAGTKMGGKYGSVRYRQSVLDALIESSTEDADGQ